jgi:hypothetical protein
MTDVLDDDDYYVIEGILKSKAFVGIDTICKSDLGPIGLGWTDIIDSLAKLQRMGYIAQDKSGTGRIFPASYHMYEKVHLTDEGIELFKNILAWKRI